MTSITNKIIKPKGKLDKTAALADIYAKEMNIKKHNKSFQRAMAKINPNGLIPPHNQNNDNMFQLSDIKTKIMSHKPRSKTNTNCKTSINNVTDILQIK